MLNGIISIKFLEQCLAHSNLLTVCIIILCLEPGWREQASPAQPPGPPRTWGGDQGRGLWQHPFPTLCSLESSGTFVHPPSTGTDCHRCICLKWLSSIWQRLFFFLEEIKGRFYATPPNTGAEVGTGKGGRERRGNRPCHIFSCVSSFSNVYISHPTSKPKCQLLSWQALLLPNRTHTWVALMLYDSIIRMIAVIEVHEMHFPI